MITEIGLLLDVGPVLTLNMQSYIKTLETFWCGWAKHTRAANICETITLGKHSTSTHQCVPIRYRMKKASSQQFFHHPRASFGIYSNCQLGTDLCDVLPHLRVQHLEVWLFETDIL